MILKNSNNKVKTRDKESGVGGACFYGNRTTWERVSEWKRNEERKEVTKDKEKKETSI